MTAEAGPADVIVADARWGAAGLEALAGRAVRAALKACGRAPERHEIAVLGCDDARIAELNATFRGRSAPTNVLSWPAFQGAVPQPGDAPLMLGDLALAFETCAHEAEAAGVDLADHATHLVVHGVLHLLGFDHADEDEAEAMERIESQILAELDIPDPYAR